VHYVGYATQNLSLKLLFKKALHQAEATLMGLGLTVDEKEIFSKHYTKQSLLKSLERLSCES
jgi:hypothetical protein